ncbi:MAG: zf-HC2 domain-containing protein [bacterium]|nr:zf-HC2 domain-containing protein [bacterium]
MADQRFDCVSPHLGSVMLAYGLGNLNGLDQEQFEEHLLVCPACQHELNRAGPILRHVCEHREEILHEAHAVDFGLASMNPNGLDPNAPSS